MPRRFRSTILAPGEIFADPAREAQRQADRRAVAEHAAERPERETADQRRRPKATRILPRDDSRQRDAAGRGILRGRGV